jgi:hypothetical protein
MSKWAIKIRGTAETLHHAITVDGLIGGNTPGKKKTAAENAEEWRDTAYWDKETKQLYVPAQNIEKCILDAAAPLKSGKTWFKKLFASGVFVEETIVPFEGISGTLDEIVKQGKAYVRADVVRVPPKTGNRVVRYRLSVKAPWTLKFTLNVAHPEITKEVLELALKNAGLFNGLGNWRPRHGRFEVVSLKAMA